MPYHQYNPAEPNGPCVECGRPLLASIHRWRPMYDDPNAPKTPFDLVVDPDDLPPIAKEVEFVLKRGTVTLLAGTLKGHASLEDVFQIEQVINKSCEVRAHLTVTGKADRT